MFLTGNQDKKGDKGSDKIADKPDYPVLPMVFCVDVEDNKTDFFLWEILDEFSNCADGQGHRFYLKRRDQPLDKGHFSRG